MTAIPKPKRERNESYLKFVRQQPCLIFQAMDGMAFCLGPVEAHHIRKGEHSGVATKPSDFTALPLCITHHHAYHGAGHDSFCDVYELDIPAEQQRLMGLYLASNPKPKRAPTTRIDADIRVKRCACGRKHFYSFTSKEFDKETMSWFCKVRNMWVSCE
jgi:hypothetical protein